MTKAGSFPAATPGATPGKSPESAQDGLVTLAARIAQAPHEFFPTLRVFRVSVATNVPPLWVGDMPQAEVSRAHEWLAEHFGPGVFRLHPLEPMGARYLPGAVDAHVGADRRPSHMGMASASSPAPAAAAPAFDPTAQALAMVNAVIATAKLLMPPTPATPAAPSVPSFDPMKFLAVGLELGQAAASKKKTKGVLGVIDVMKENADVVMPLANGALELGKGFLDWLKDVSKEAKQDKAAAAAAATVQQPSSSPTPAAVSSPTNTEGAPSTGGGQGDAPPASASTSDAAPIEAEVVDE